MKIMKSKSLVLMLFVGMSIMCSAQDVTKPVVNVEGFNYSSDFSAEDAYIVRNNVIQSLQRTKRIIVVDLSQQSSVQSEAERRKSEAAMNDNHEVADIAQLNANFILKGSLNSISTEQRQGTDYKTGQKYYYYASSMEYTIQLIDPSTGATISSHTYTSSGTDNNSSSYSHKEAVASTNKNMSKFIEEVFPVRGTILQVAEGNERKAKSVYINLGTDQGIQKGQKFVVYEVVDIAGEKSEKEIGELTVVEVMSGSRTQCKVNSGGDAIANNLASNKELIIKSRAKKAFLGGLGGLLL